jgi:adenosylhomocysteine nucleosidase
VAGPRSRRWAFAVTSQVPAVVVGFAAEARVARLFGWQVAIGGGTTEGAAQAARRLIGAGAAGIVSFGLAGGLDPSLPAGTLVVAEAVAANGRVWQADPALSARLGGITGHLCLGLDRVVASTDEKRHLSRETGAALVDMESGAVAEAAAEAGVPFAVLRAICDPAGRALPPAALVALDSTGRLAALRLAMSILASPGQLGQLLGLARDAGTARRALRARALQMLPVENLQDRTVESMFGFVASGADFA